MSRQSKIALFGLAFFRLMEGSLLPHIQIEPTQQGQQHIAAG